MNTYKTKINPHKTQINLHKTPISANASDILIIYSSVIMFWPITLHSSVRTQHVSPKLFTHIAENTGP